MFIFGLVLCAFAHGVQEARSHVDLVRVDVDKAALLADERPTHAIRTEAVREATVAPNSLGSEDSPVRRPVERDSLGSEDSPVRRPVSAGGDSSQAAAVSSEKPSQAAAVSSEHSSQAAAASSVDSSQAAAPSSVDSSQAAAVPTGSLLQEECEGTTSQHVRVSAVEVRAQGEDTSAEHMMVQYAGYRELCTLAFVVAAIGWCLRESYKTCCSDDAFWYNLTCVKRLRREMLKEANARDLSVVVHRTRQIPLLGTAVVIGVIPRKARDTAKAPKPALCLTKTGKSVDGKWEQALRVHMRQGYSVLQLGIFKHGTLSNGSLVGYASLDLREARTWQRQDCKCVTADGKYIGDIVVSVRDENDSDDEAGSARSRSGSRSGSDRLSLPTSRKSRPVSPTSEGSRGSSRPQNVEMLMEDCSGPIRVADTSGKLSTAFFRAERKKSILVWAWYSDREMQKRLGRIPVVSIKAVTPVQRSISDFIVQYEDENRVNHELILQRVNHERELLVKNLRALMAAARDGRTSRVNTQSTQRTTRNTVRDSAKSTNTLEMSWDDRWSADESDVPSRASSVSAVSAVSASRSQRDTSSRNQSPERSDTKRSTRKSSREPLERSGTRNRSPRPEIFSMATEGRDRGREEQSDAPKPTREKTRLLGDDRPKRSTERSSTPRPDKERESQRSKRSTERAPASRPDKEKDSLPRPKRSTERSVSREPKV